MAMEIFWSLSFLAVLFSVDGTHSHKGSQGLSCVNDLINNVSCTWSGSPVAPGVNCSITGVKKTRVIPYNMKYVTQIIRSCKLEQRGRSPPGCSFVFENKEFHCMKKMPYIRMECDGRLVQNLTNYDPCDHIKMHPPGVPNVSSDANETWISWSKGAPVSDFFEIFEFHVQIKRKNQTWTEASNLFTHDFRLRIPSSQVKGHRQVRVRVHPTQFSHSHWSDWSPATSWEGPPDMVSTSENKGWLQNLTSMLIHGVIFGLFLVLVVVVLLCGKYMSKGLHKEKPVPNPSKYFHTLHSVHGGNLKKWLNPLSAPESFFTAEPCDHISPVELCESSDVAPSSPTSALLHLKAYPSAGSDTSEVMDNSSSSSCFSNMGYFLSSSSGGSARTDPNPAYFIYQDDFRNARNSHNLHLTLCSSTATTSPAYESLKREPQSPDSGFGIGMEDGEDKGDQNVVVVEEEEVSDNHQTSPLLILPLHLPSTEPPPTPDAASITQVSSESQQVDAAMAAASGSYVAWPSASAMCRSSSMPVEPSKTGYLTLKELQTTFSNKSI